MVVIFSFTSLDVRIVMHGRSEEGRRRRGGRAAEVIKIYGIIAHFGPKQ